MEQVSNELPTGVTSMLQKEGQVPPALPSENCSSDLEDGVEKNDKKVDNDPDQKCDTFEKDSTVILEIPLPESESNKENSKIERDQSHIQRENVDVVAPTRKPKQEIQQEEAVLTFADVQCLCRQFANFVKWMEFQSNQYTFDFQILLNLLARMELALNSGIYLLYSLFWPRYDPKA